MRKTKALWVHLGLYFGFNAAVFHFYTLPGQDLVWRWLLALFVIFTFLFFAGHLYIYTRKTDLLETQLQEYCRQLEADLKKELESGQIKSQFIRNAYHEVQGQFWGIFVISGLLRKGLQKGFTGSIHKMLEDLSNGCQNLQLLLTNILEYARHESGIPEGPRYEAIEIRRNMTELIDIAQYTASEKNIKIEAHISKEIPDYIAYDRIKMNQVMTNLINNAVKFSEGDTIIVILLDKDTDKWHISVKDQGKGITASALPYIFDPFLNAKDSGRNAEGMGLGLYIARHLVTALQGAISVKSEEKTGTCFTVELPIIPFELLKDMTFRPVPAGI
jgi:signal transduction histidine kinase